MPPRAVSPTKARTKSSWGRAMMWALTADCPAVASGVHAALMLSNAAASTVMSPPPMGWFHEAHVGRLTIASLADAADVALVNHAERFTHSACVDGFVAGNHLINCPYPAQVAGAPSCQWDSS